MASVSSGSKSKGSLAACSASSMIASITGCMPRVGEHHAAQDFVFDQFLDLGLDHHHGVVGAGDDQVHPAVLHLVERRVEHVLAVDEADAGAADRAHEGRAGDHQGGGGGDQGDDVGIVLEVVGEHGADHLHFVLEALDEQRADRTVDQAGGQGFLLRRARLRGVGRSRRDLAGGVELLLVVHGQGEEVLARLRRSWRRRRWPAPWSRRRWPGRRRRPDGPCGRFRASASAAPLDGLAFDVEHFRLLSRPAGVFPAGADRGSVFRNPLQ